MRRAISVLFLGLLAGSCARPAPPNRVRIVLDAEPSSLDPARATSVVEGELLAKVCEGLVRFDGARVAPGLAETWTVSPDGREVRFRLRAGVRFHDGSAFDAEDVLATFRRLLDTATASPRTWVLEDIASSFAPDSRTVVLRLRAPRGAFLALLAMPNAAILPSGTPVAKTDTPIGTGPYRVATWRRNDRILLTANRDYRGGVPRVDGLEYRILPDALAAWSFFQRGQVDVWEVPAAMRPQVVGRTDLGRMMEAEVLATVYVALNCERIDPGVRARLAHVVGSETIVKAILNGAGTAATSPIPPALGTGSKGTGSERSEVPVPDRELVLLVSSRRSTQEPAEAVAAFLRDAGIRVRLVPMEWTSMKERVGQGDYDLAYLSWYADYPDAENFLIPVFHSRNLGAAGNRARLSDPTLDRILDELVSAPLGPARDVLVARAEARALASDPWILLWHPRQAVLVAPRVEGWTVPPVYNGFDASQVDLR